MSEKQIEAMIKERLFKKTRVNVKIKKAKHCKLNKVCCFKRLTNIQKQYNKKDDIMNRLRMKLLKRKLRL